MGDLGSIPGLGRSPGERKGYPLQYSGLENSMDCIVYEVAKSQTRPSDCSFTLDFVIYNIFLYIGLLFSVHCFHLFAKFGLTLFLFFFK